MLFFQPNSYPSQIHHRGFFIIHESKPINTLVARVWLPSNCLFQCRLCQIPGSTSFFNQICIAMDWSPWAPILGQSTSYCQDYTLCYIIYDLPLFSVLPRPSNLFFENIQCYVPLYLSNFEVMTKRIQLNYHFSQIKLRMAYHFSQFVGNDKETISLFFWFLY